MFLRQLKIVLLLAYLVLFWNLAPAAHHADLFGLHANHGQSESVACCCGTHHHPDSSGSVVPFHDCAFCKFFDQFNVVIEIEESVVEAAPVFLATLLSPPIHNVQAYSPTARGPPVAHAFLFLV